MECEFIDAALFKQFFCVFDLKTHLVLKNPEVHQRLYTTAARKEMVCHVCGEVVIEELGRKLVSMPCPDLRILPDIGKDGVERVDVFKNAEVQFKVNFAWRIDRDIVVVTLTCGISTGDKTRHGGIDIALFYEDVNVTACTHALVRVEGADDRALQGQVVNPRLIKRRADFAVGVTHLSVSIRRKVILTLKLIVKCRVDINAVLRDETGDNMRQIMLLCKVRDGDNGIPCQIFDEICIIRRTPKH